MAMIHNNYETYGTMMHCPTMISAIYIPSNSFELQECLTDISPGKGHVFLKLDKNVSCSILGGLRLC